MDARLAIREKQEHSVTGREKAAYVEKFDSLMMFDCRRSNGKRRPNATNRNGNTAFL